MTVLKLNSVSLSLSLSLCLSLLQSPVASLQFNTTDISELMSLLAMLYSYVCSVQSSCDENVCVFVVSSYR